MNAIDDKTVGFSKFEEIITKCEHLAAEVKEVTHFGKGIVLQAYPRFLGTFGRAWDHTIARDELNT